MMWVQLIVSLSSMNSALAWMLLLMKHVYRWYRNSFLSFLSCISNGSGNFWLAEYTQALLGLNYWENSGPWKDWDSHSVLLFLLSDKSNCFAVTVSFLPWHLCSSIILHAKSFIYRRPPLPIKHIKNSLISKSLCSEYRGLIIYLGSNLWYLTSNF